MEESTFEILAKSRKFKTTKIFWGLINNYRPKIKELSKIHSRIARFTQDSRIAYWNTDSCNIRFKLVMKAGNLNLIRVR